MRIEEGSRAALEDVVVVYLDTSFETAKKRAGGDPARPLFATGDPEALFEEIYRARRGAP